MPIRKGRSPSAVRDERRPATSEVFLGNPSFANGGLSMNGKNSDGWLSRMTGTPDAQLSPVDDDHLQAGELCLALGAGKHRVLCQAWRVTRNRSEYHGWLTAIGFVKQTNGMHIKQRRTNTLISTSQRARV